MKHLKRMVIMCISLTLLFGLCMTAQALEAPDLTKMGSITVEMTDGGKTVTGGTLTLYRVGEFVEDNGNWAIQKTPTMAEFSGSYENLESPELAQQVDAFVKEQKIASYATADNVDGKAVFFDVEQGLYLVAQTAASDGYESLNSFLVTVPMYEGDHYVYDVNASGKFELTKKPEPSKPTNPTEPTEPDLPHTGQLNWPVPVMAVLGGGLLALGLALWQLGRRGRRDA